MVAKGPEMSEPAEAGPDRKSARKRELLLFFILAIAVWPIIAVALVGGFGFILWMYQIITGPPGPPPVG